MWFSKPVIAALSVVSVVALAFVYTKFIEDNIQDNTEDNRKKRAKTKNDDDDTHEDRSALPSEAPTEKDQEPAAASSPKVGQGSLVPEVTQSLEVPIQKFEEIMNPTRVTSKGSSAYRSAIQAPSLVIPVEATRVNSPVLSRENSRENSLNDGSSNDGSSNDDLGSSSSSSMTYVPKPAEIEFSTANWGDPVVGIDQAPASENVPENENNDPVPKKENTTAAELGLVDNSVGSPQMSFRNPEYFGMMRATIEAAARKAEATAASVAQSGLAEGAASGAAAGIATSSESKQNADKKLLRGETEEEWLIRSGIELNSDEKDDEPEVVESEPTLCQH